MARMSRTHVRRRLLAISMLALASGLAWVVPAGGVAASPTRPAQQRYVVRPGDTLWSIARGIQDGDPRALVDAIQAANGADPGALAPGQVLLIPTVG
ncbi:MAG: LysM peptidoglycan-binding domain-containing protein [Actinobacteria bacterium]|nr:MAG: LysM peptidoglycan-binding domain-containing protein [Actinomycetota bacterium]